MNVFACCTSAIASPWPQEQGEALVINRSENFSSSGFRQISTSTYVEYGISDTLTAGGKATYAAQEYSGAFANSATGFTAAELFFQKEIFRTDTTIYSGRLTYAAPTILSRQALTQETKFDDIRYGDTLEAAFLVGRSLNDDGTIFIAAETGYQHSFGDDADLIRADIVAGIKRGQNWMVLFKSFNSAGLGNSTAQGVDYDIFRLEPELVYQRQNGRGYSIGAAYDLGGRNLKTGSSVYFSFWNRF